MYFQKRNLAVPAMLLLVLICTALLAAKDNPMGIAEKQTISFTVPTVVGGTLLPAGNYNVTHEMKGQTHVMIFQQIGGKKAEAKANCNFNLQEWTLRKLGETVTELRQAGVTDSEIRNAFAGAIRQPSAK